jgi:rare lipoprotein A
LRPETGITTWRRARPGLRALMIGIPASATVLSPGQALAAAAPQPLQVGLGAEHSSPAEAVRVHDRRIAVLTGQRVQVRGRLLPALPGRKVALQALENGAWQTLATARTRATGAFVLRYVTAGAGRAPLRVQIAGERLTGRMTTRAGEMTVYRQAGASWYNDGGNTACGFHAYYGVANRTLPCGTSVSFRYNGRSVTATVDDRGPYVGGRDWDLNQNTAAALGFGGVGVVWSSQ